MKREFTNEEKIEILQGRLDFLYKIILEQRQKLNDMSALIAKLVESKKDKRC